MVCTAIVGAGFRLFYGLNTYPAQVFMGDVGSLATGWGHWVLFAVLVRQELLLIIMGGVFVMEALSVIFTSRLLQITWANAFFRMAPIHHHYELKRLAGATRYCALFG